MNETIDNNEINFSKETEKELKKRKRLIIAIIIKSIIAIILLILLIIVSGMKEPEPNCDLGEPEAYIYNGGNNNG